MLVKFDWKRKKKMIPTPILHSFLKYYFEDGEK